MTPTIDFSRVKLDNPLVDVLERYLGPGKRSGRELSWLCPFHAEKSGSFKTTADPASAHYGRYKCFGCGAHGDVLDFVQQYENLSSPTDAAMSLGGFVLHLDREALSQHLAQVRVENERKRAEAKAKEEETIRQALDKVAGMESRVETYHKQVKPALTYWHGQGLRDNTIKKFKLGYCPNFRIYQDDQPVDVASYVIPVRQSGQLVSIRHRIAGAVNGNKYRPEFGGLPAAMFNVDILDSLQDHDQEGEICFSSSNLLDPGECIMMEGEIKAMFFDQLGIPTVGIPGVQTWARWGEEWINYFTKRVSQIYIALDPGEAAQEAAWKIGLDFIEAGIAAKIVEFETKPDDWLNLHKGSVGGFLSHLRWGRPVKRQVKKGGK